METLVALIETTDLPTYPTDVLYYPPLVGEKAGRIEAGDWVGYDHQDGESHYFDIYYCTLQNYCNLLLYSMNSNLSTLFVILHLRMTSRPKHRAPLGPRAKCIRVHTLEYCTFTT